MVGIVFGQMDSDEKGTVTEQNVINWPRHGRDLYKEILDAAFTAELGGGEDEP